MKTTNFLLILLGSCLILCFVLMLMNNITTKIEGFDPVLDSIQSQLKAESPEQLSSTVKALQQRLIDYGYAQDLNNFVKKTELNPNSGKCLVTNAEDRDKYISKSEIDLPGPRIDLSQYVKKSSIPPVPVCPPQQEIDYSAYVKKSTLPPNEKCPPCIAPKVKVSAGLCRECPPAPSCPAPERCPEVKCPPPAPCPTIAQCTKCDEIRYIKVPAVITKTITLDSKGNVVKQQIDSGSTNPTQTFTTQAYTTKQNTTQPNTTQPSTTQSTNQSTTTQPFRPNSVTTQNSSQQSSTPLNLFNTMFGSLYHHNEIPGTTFPVMSSNTPNITLAQSLDDVDDSNSSFCPSPELNSDFKSYGIYGIYGN